MESAQQLPEPHRIIGIVMADLFLHQMIEQGNTKGPGGCHPELGIHTGGQNGVGDAVFIILHLLQREGENFREGIIVVGVLEAVAHKAADRIKKVGVDNNIPVLAGVPFLPVEVMHIGQIQKAHIARVECLGLAIEGVGDGAL